MNVENIISALQDAQTVVVTFAGTPNKTYTYKVQKEWKVEVGDELVVRSPWNGSVVVTVKEVNEAMTSTCRLSSLTNWLYLK